MRKKAAAEYAKLVISGIQDDGKEVELRQQLGFPDRNSISEKTVQSPNHSVQFLDPEQIERVGIWKRHVINGETYFIRDKSIAYEFQHWAKVDRIMPKNKMRIVFLGESVARGYLLDPYFTPCKYLQQLLDIHSEQPVEIVDLARTSIHIHELEDLCVSSLALQPDMLVIFAGNNWRYTLYPLSDAEVEQIKAWVHDENRFDRIRQLLENKCLRMIDKFFSTLSHLSKQYQLPIVFVIPEFNLKEWRSVPDDLILLWPNGKTSEWETIKEEAELAFRENRFIQAESWARELIRINKANPYGYELIARCKYEAGLWEEARIYFESARDCSLFRRVSRPSCNGFMRKFILEQKEKLENLHIVDLPEVFKAELKGDIPGNDLFLDYCHLNVKGIQLAMKHVCQTVLSLIQGRDVLVDEIREPDVQIEDQVIADAYFLAAVHSAHIGDQSSEVLYESCKKALQKSKRMTETMTHFIDLASRKIPWILNKKSEYFIQAGYAKQYPILYQPEDVKTLDINLVDAMIRALQEEGVKLEHEVFDLRTRYFGVNERKVDMLETYYRETSYMYAGRVSGYFARSRGYISSISRVSRFYLIVDRNRLNSGSEVVLELTYRTPNDSAHPKEIVIKGNGIFISKSNTSNEWNDLTVKFPLFIMKDNGVNIIEIEWPYIDEWEEKMILENSRKYKGDDWYVRCSRLAYGDIHRFYAYVNKAQ